MNNNTIKIWNAWLDGKTVEKWDSTKNGWYVNDPSLFSLDQQPHSKEIEWRVKKTHFRIFIIDKKGFFESTKIATANFEEGGCEAITQEIENQPNFVRWVGNWKELEETP
jgi:hypothetical protein